MNGQAQAANPYLRTKVMTAGPMELRLMLYDGALKFCRQARNALAHHDFETSYNALMRAQNITLELANSLRPDVQPSLCERMSGLYNYLYRRLVDANMERDPAIVDECIELVEYERETWQMLIRKAEQESPELFDQHATPAADDNASTPDESGKTGSPLASIGPKAPHDAYQAQPNPGFSVQG